ncbi:MAG TPA: heme exporter protein CcmD [Pyrinomonadaceae bacterium]|nr:heme exporter protein CcmD [Pyrinomonadaceae bacterium]
MNWSEFFSMGGYAFYVWGSYLFAFVLLVAEILFLLRRQKALRRTGTRNSFDS